MKVIILSAGKSTRLLPLTKDIHQSLLMVGGKTIIERQIESLAGAGVKINDIIVVTGYLSQKLEKLCQASGIKTLFNPFYNISGTSASLWAAKSETEDGFMFCYSDILFDQEIIKGLLNNSSETCLAIKKDGLRTESERVVEEGGTAKRISKAKLEKENSEFVGIAKFSKTGGKKIVHELENALRENIETSFIEVIDRLIKSGETVTTYDIGDSRFVDIDFSEDLTKAAELFS